MENNEDILKELHTNLENIKRIINDSFKTLEKIEDNPENRAFQKDFILYLSIIMSKIYEFKFKWIGKESS